MGDYSRHQARNSLLAELAAARADLAQQYVDAVRKCGAARMVLSLATKIGIGAGEGGTSLTVTQLVGLVKQCESEGAEIRELLAQVDARLAEASPVAAGSVH